MSKPFRFKSFSIEQDLCAMKVGTDGVLLGAWTDCLKHKTILDIGTGTGVIALMMAQRNPEAQIHALEIDQTAAKQAKENFNRTPWADRLEIIPQSLQEFWRATDTTFDHIVTNPPFFTGGTLSGSQDKNSVRHTTKLSHSDLLGAIRNLLKPNGTCSLILPTIEGYRCIELARTYNLYPIRMTEVYPDQTKPLERLLITFAKQEVEHLADKLYIRNHDSQDFDEEYQQLTSEFYLKF